MKSLPVLVAISLAMLAACEARNPSPAIEASEPESEPRNDEAVPVEVDPEFADAVLGLELFDSAAGISALDVAPQDSITGLTPPKFALHCDAASKTLEVVAPARQLGPYAVAGPARFVASGATFEGEAVLIEADGTSVSMTLPITPELLAGIATTLTARIVIGDGFAESNVDTNGAFPGFAGQCSLKSGVLLPPP